MVKVVVFGGVGGSGGGSGGGKPTLGEEELCGEGKMDGFVCMK